MQIELLIHPSYEVASYPEPVGPKRRRLYDCFNKYHEAQGLADEAAMAELREIVPALLLEFEQSEANESHNPEWRKYATRAGWHSAMGEYDEALKLDKLGWDSAKVSNGDQNLVSKQKSISASNIGDALNRLGRFEEAVQWGRIACGLWDQNPINWLVFSISLFHAGYEEESEKLLGSLVEYVKKSGPGSLKVAIYEDLLADVSVASAERLVQAVYST